MPDLVIREDPAPHVVRLTLNRPDDLNAMTSDLAEGLHTALHEIRAERSCLPQRRRFDADEALRIGLVADVVEPDALAARALEGAAPPEAIAAFLEKRAAEFAD